MPTMPVARTVPALIDEMALRFPDREALVGSGQRYTFSELRLEVRRIARGLAALGVQPGDKVAILMGNQPEWIIADLAIFLLGGVMVGVNTWATPRELEYVLHHSDSTLLITSGRYLKYDYLEMLATMTPRSTRLPRLREVILASDTDQTDCRPYRDLARLAESVPESVIDAAQQRIDPKDICYLLYTSGSTSNPKGVLLQHDALIENMWQIGERQRIR